MPVPVRRLAVMSLYELCGCTLRSKAGAPMRAMPRHATSEIAVHARRENFQAAGSMT